MAFGDDWDEPVRRRGAMLGDAGMGVLRVVLLFGSAAVAVALILTPILASQTERMAYSSRPVGIDMMATGTIGPGQRGGSAYVVRRSVLQSSPSSVCIIRPNGMRSGDC